MFTINYLEGRTVNANFIVTEANVTSQTNCISDITVSGVVCDENGKKVEEAQKELKGFSYRNVYTAKKGIKKAIAKAFGCQGISIDEAKLEDIAIRTLIK